MQVNPLALLLSGIGQLCHWGGTGLHLSSASVFARAVMYSVKGRTLPTTEVLFPPGKFGLFLAAQISFEVGTKDD